MIRICPHLNAATCRAARLANLKAVHSAGRKSAAVPRTPASLRDLDFGIQVFAPQRQVTVPTQSECQHDAADTVLLAPRRPSAPLVPSSRAASSSRSRSPISTRCDPVHSPTKDVQHDSTALDVIHRSLSPSAQPASTFRAAHALEPICIGVPVPQMLQNLKQPPILQNSGNTTEAGSSISAVPPFPLRPMKRQGSGPQLVMPIEKRAPQQRPETVRCVAAEHESRSRSRSKSPGRPAASHPHAAPAAPAAVQSQGARSRVTPPASDNVSGHRDDSLTEREQLAALLECSPAHSQPAHGAGHPQHVHQPVVDVITGAGSESGGEWLQGEVSLRHHARSSSGAAADRSGTESEQAARSCNPPEQGCCDRISESDAQQSSNIYASASHEHHHVKGVGGHFPQHHDSDVADSVQQAEQKPLSQQSLRSEHRGRGDVWQHPTAGWVATPSEVDPALPASIRFSTTTDHDAGGSLLPDLYCN